MKTDFYKYHGTGNDFIMIDNRKGAFDTDNHGLIHAMCERRTGIGADGLIVLEQDDRYDFAMRYFNADGYEGTLCGNGGRCVVQFARHLGIIEHSAVFKAVDGIHRAEITNEIVSLEMGDVSDVKLSDSYVYLNTGSPHYVKFITEDIHTFPVREEGKKIRYADSFAPEGTNVNFVKQMSEDAFYVRTYERGVEAETLSCGTGVTAVALAAYETGKTQKRNITLHTRGGVLRVSFEKKGNVYTRITLQGQAVRVYEGTAAI